MKTGRLMNVEQRTVSGARKTQFGLVHQDPEKTKKHFWGAPGSVMETINANSLSLMHSLAGVDCLHLATLFVVALLVQQFIKNNCNPVSSFEYTKLFMIF